MTHEKLPRNAMTASGQFFLIFSMLECKTAVFSHIALFSVRTADISSRNMTIPLAHHPKIPLWLSH